MKFLCPSCKAKYQIADEKVAGRSVRMKCRKCGYVIQVSSVAGMGDALPGSEAPPALDALSDVSAAPPGVAPDSEPATSSAPLSILPEPPPAPSPSPPKVGVPRPPMASISRPGEVKKPLAPARPTPSVVRPASVLGAKPAVPAAKAPGVLAKPPTPAPKAPPAKSSPVQPAAILPKPAVTAPLPAVAPKPSAPEAAPVLTANALPDTYDEDESTRIADGGALAGAFSLAVGGAAADAPAADASMPADEWFVGINGVPVGPIRLSELRSKAASGAISRESLVWRDGFEDWRPLRTFPELLAIVDEGLSSVRASLTPFTPPVATASAAAAAAAPSHDVTAPLPAVGIITSDPFAASAASGVTGAAVVTDELDAAGVPKRGGSPVGAWLAVAMAVLFGLTIGFVLFKTQAPAPPPKTVTVYVDRPVPSAAGDTAAASDGKVTALDETTVGDSKNAAKHPVTTGAKSANAPSASAEPTETTKNLQGLQGLQGLGSGPKGPDSSGPSGAVQGTGQLDGGQIQSTVARYTGSVKRACWQPALDTRDKDAPTTARVNVAITVLPSGSVSNAAVGGDPKGYRGLSQCISSRVRGWQFPPSGDSTTVNVPFVFAAQ